MAETPVRAAETVVAAPPLPSAEESEAANAEAALVQIISAAKKDFREEQYPSTIKRLETAVKLAPENSDVLQFRGFAHFANGDFEAAAADVYDALLLGNTWNWEAVYDLYQSKDVYQGHLRTLEAVRRAAPNLSHHFLLGYHYLVLNHLDRGQKELEQALKFQPDEPLLTQLITVVKEIRAK